MTPFSIVFISVLMVAGKRRAGCADGWRVQTFTGLGFAVFTAGLKMRA